MNEVAVLVVDMLNDFIDGELGFEGAKAIIGPINDLASKIRDKGGMVVFCNDCHTPEDGEFKKWGPHAVEGTWGCQICPEVENFPTDYIVPKRRYSGFFQTSLNLLLQEHRIRKVIVVGLHTDMCVRHTAADAFQWGYEVIVPTDCVASFDKKDKNDALEYMRKVYDASTPFMRNIEI